MDAHAIINRCNEIRSANFNNEFGMVGARTFCAIHAAENANRSERREDYDDMCNDLKVARINLRMAEEHVEMNAWNDANTWSK